MIQYDKSQVAKICKDAQDKVDKNLDTESQNFKDGYDSALCDIARIIETNITSPDENKVTAIVRYLELKNMGS